MTVITDMMRGKLPLPDKQSTPLLLTEIVYNKSVIHACIQHTGREIGDALGVGDPALLDQFLATEAGKRWHQGFREYAIFVLGKTV